MKKNRQGARAKILQAAEEIAVESGPGNMALEAVAARAGISKGGLLYHFPSKAKLLEALVEAFLMRQDAALTERERESEGAPNSVARAYLDFFDCEHRCKRPPGASLLAALAEDPGFLQPVGRFERDFLDRMKANATDPTAAVMLLLSVHGIRAMQLLSLDIVTEAEIDAVRDRLKAMLA